MPRKPIKFELDFMIKDIFPRFTVKQFDDVSFNIKPLNQGLDYDTSNMIGKIFVGVNNDMFMQTTDITVSSDNINVLLDKNMLQKNGRAYAEIELTDEAGTITSSSFIFDIDPKIGEGGMIPGEYEGFVEKYERLISEFKAQINSSIDNSNNLIDKTIKNCNTSIDTKLSTVDSRFNSKVAEVDSKLDTVDRLITAKVSDFERRFSALTSSQQQNSEVIDAREGEVSLKARLDKDIENPKKLYTSIEGTEISVDSLEGYLKDIEILGNTVQDQDNLADIRSVGDKLENQELYEIPVLITNGLDNSDSSYQEQQITILSHKQLKSYNGTKDRIVCKNGVWVHEENVTYDAEGNGTILSKSIDTPLPHDQQISIRTFANKTNIHFECEIEPTLKASVPKSIGATANTHTEQIDNLGKELDRVEKLEESTASTVTTESDFTTVTETSNGYFEDVKLEGKTLVNVAYKPHLLPKITHVDNEYVCNNVGTQDNSGIQWREPGMFKIGQIYTIIFTVRNTSSTDIEFVSGYDMSGTGWRVIATIPANTSKRVIYTKQYTNTTINYYLINLASKTAGASFAISDDILILEGDHTQNPPEFFEGIKSVGDGVDEISVLTQNKEETKENEKRILYHNTETDTWEKPILRQFDTIEKHSDNKYYYHVRSEEVPYTEGDETKADHITDMTTTVKKLSTEKVYECTNLDLITYSGETNLVTRSGVLNPKATLKVKKGIGNVVTLLQNKVSMLEDLVSKLIQNK